MTLALALAALLAPAAQDRPKTGGPFDVDLAKPGTKYWLQVPEDYAAEKSWPLLVILHGAGDTAENFIKFWSEGGRKAKYILAACKSRGQAWDDSDGDIILGVMEDVKKRYTVDSERTMLLGYSSGGFMATRWGFRHCAPFRAITAIAGAEPGGGREYQQAVGRMSVLIEAGTEDPNLGCCKEVFAKVKKDGFDCDCNWVPKMQHSPLLPEAMEWVYAQLAKRLDAPAERMKRGRKASAAKRYADAIEEFQALCGGGGDEKASKAAKAELERIEKLARDKYAEAQKKLDKGDRAGAKKLLEEVVRFVGLECASKAAEALKELR